MEDGFDYQTAIEEFQDERPVWKQIWAAIITEFTPDKKNWFGAAFSFVLALILTIIIARSEETVSLAGKICGILLDVEIALFGCVFAVYSILLAFLSDEYVKKLLEIDYYRQTNYLRKSTKYYEAALFIYFVAIGISLVYKLTIECMPQNFALINSELANEIVAGVLLFPYFFHICICHNPLLLRVFLHVEPLFPSIDVVLQPNLPVCQCICNGTFQRNFRFPVNCSLQL